jgi:hypothetical protein
MFLNNSIILLGIMFTLLSRFFNNGVKNGKTKNRAKFLANSY